MMPPLPDLAALDPEPAGRRLYLRPLGMVDGAGGVALAGGCLAFDRVAVHLRDPAAPAAVEQAIAGLAALEAWAARHGRAAEIADRLAALSRPRADFAGLTLDRPRIMAVINVTPDSFSDGGDFLDADRALAQARAAREAGADILDIGGESTRPGAAPVPPEEEIRRIDPVVRPLAAAGATVSIDTRHAAVMAAALDAGAAIVNDVTGLAGDPASLALIGRRRPPTVLMHMQGEPQTMQAAPRYDAVALDVYDALEARVAAAEAAGLPRERILVDPGIGFGKTAAHNLALLRQTALFHGLGCGVIVGVSRKSFIGRLSRGEPAKQRVPGSLAAGLAALDGGAQVLRVHDVAETAQALAVWRALRERSAQE